jgi:hypothetical protein
MKLRNKKTGEIIDGYIRENGNFHVAVFKKDYTGSLEDQRSEWYFSLAELNKEWEDYEEPKDWGGYIISCGDNYIEPVCAGFSDKTIEKCNELGMLFETKEEALKAVEKLKAWKRLKDKGFRFEGWGTGGEYGSTITFSDDIEYNDETIADLDLLFRGEK